MSNPEHAIRPSPSDRNDPRGSLWRRWDLHVHTPASLVHHYGSPSENAWSQFIDEIEALPPELSVLGINDYLILDGYRRLVSEKAAGRLQNIKTLLPVIEFRLDKFGGTAGALSRVNFHVIFSDELTADQIQSQFLNLLVKEYTIAPGNTWRAVPTSESLVELGSRIIAAVPASERHRYGAPIVEGFNNLNYSLETIQSSLDNSFLHGRYLTAVGKTEWWDVKWNEQSIAEKRHVIESADFVFVAAASPDHCRRAKEALKVAGVNCRLLDCSDAHHFAGSGDKDRIGHCYTWLKADPTFEGLRQVRQAAEERVHLGERPGKLVVVATNPTKFVRSISVRRRPEATLAQRWFDGVVHLNHDLVAIIGNKGMGKSALADIIALAANTDAPEGAFSFLHPKRFRERREAKAKNFVATLTWESGDANERGLDESVPAGTVPLVRYIPQHYFEELCNETSDPSLLQAELRKVIFGNLSELQRAGYGSLDEIIDDKTAEAQRRIDELRGELHAVNREIVALERDLSISAERDLRAALRQQELALAHHDESKPIEVPVPAGAQPTPALDTARSQSATIDERLRAEQAKLVLVSRKRDRVGTVRARFAAMSEALDRLRESSFDELLTLGLNVEDVLRVSIDLAPLEAVGTALDQELAQTRTLIDGVGGLREQAEAVRTAITDLQDELDAPARERQRYLDSLSEWERQRSALVGDEETSGSVVNLKARLTSQRESKQQELHGYRQDRSRILRAIHGQYRSVIEVLEGLYAGVDARIRSHPIVSRQIAVNFTAGLMDTGLADTFTGMINRTRTGRFSVDGAAKARTAVCDLNIEGEVEVLVEELVQDLLMGDGSAGDIGELQRQLRRGVDPEAVYNYLYGLEYVSPRYGLRIADRDVAQLTLLCQILRADRMRALLY